MNSLLSQLSHLPLVWMFHDRALNSKVEFHDVALRSTLPDSSSNFEECLANVIGYLFTSKIKAGLKAVYKLQKALNSAFKLCKKL